MEFRDSLNRTAVQLQKNLDKRKLDLTDIEKTFAKFILLVVCILQSRYNFKYPIFLGRQTEDRTFSLKIDNKSGPKIVEEKPAFKKPTK